MAQDFVMSAPLIQGHGNFGSIDNDPAAAMRYTEVGFLLAASRLVDLPGTSKRLLQLTTTVLQQC